ncbi:MAG: P63C domain-containing protein, partial [Acidobacteriia bacterium]|nr:P63C domain-containing protein [Terriglobia bacterium]
NLKPFIDEELALALSKPILYRVSGTGMVANGIDARNLSKVCNVWLKARDAGNVLTKPQERIAIAADILLRGFAETGIDALVDEATGYQYERARDALAKILEAFIAKELRAWVRTFPSEFYQELFRLRNIPYKEDVKRPQYIGHLTNDLVYARLAPGVLDELRRQTPRDEKGRLRTHLHRRLTEDLGHPKLLQHLSAVTALMKVSDTWRQFKSMVDRALPRYKRLPLFDGLEPEETKA